MDQFLNTIYVIFSQILNYHKHGWMQMWIVSHVFVFGTDNFLYLSFLSIIYYKKNNWIKNLKTYFLKYRTIKNI